MRECCHDVAPDGAVGAASVVNDDDMPSGNIIQKIPDGAALHYAAGTILDSKRPSSELDTMHNGLDAVATGGDSDLVHGVGHAGGVQVFERLNQCIG